MLQKILKNLSILKDKLPLTYSIVLIIAVPLALILNTWWNVRSFERDMDFSVRDKALAMQQTFTALIKDDINSADQVDLAIRRIIASEPSLISASVLLQTPEGEFDMLASSHPDSLDEDEKIFINQLAWSQEESYFAKTYDQVTGQNVWMVISPLYGPDDKRIGVINFKVITTQVDQVVARTTRDALIILGVSVVIIVLLLINHLRFFERSLMVDKLKQIDKMKDDFISLTSHELKNPMVAIKSGIFLIKEKFQDNIPQETAEIFGMIEQSVSQLNNLVKDLLNVSRIQQNRLDFDMTSIDPAIVINEVFEQLKFSAENKGLQLNFTPPAAPVYILANLDRFREVVLNLVSNSIKYTLAGSVTVALVSDNKNVKLQVQDTGIGISPEDKEKLFDKFVRIYNEKTQDVPGTGLGLWITKELVEKMQGRIYVDSILDQGTVFTVVLRAGQSPPAPTPVPPPQQSSNS